MIRKKLGGDRMLTIAEAKKAGYESLKNNPTG